MATTVSAGEMAVRKPSGVETPRAIRNLGLGQFLFAFIFVVWLLFWPEGGERFAWPVTPRLTAVFIGTSFILRTLLGLAIIRTREWWRLRWAMWGNYTFLGIILGATFWHVEEMNFSSQIVIAHVWILIYIFEPFILPFLGPFGPEAKAPIAPEEQRGPLLRGLQRVFVVLFMIGASLAGLFFISPEFMTTRWPWELDPFNARIMAAWPGAVAVWSATLYFVRDWAEARLAVLVFIVYGFALFAAFLLTLPLFDMARHNVWTYGLLPAVAALLLLYYYWRQERQAAQGLSEL